MKYPLQRRPSGASRLSDSPGRNDRMRSRPAPDAPLQASAIDARSRNGNASDGLNDALTAAYVPHSNDPALWADSPIADFEAYGPRVDGPLFHQGEGDAHRVSGNDVHQGSIGNCYFLAALAGVARQRPELMENAIEGPLSDGTYNVTLYSSTSWDESATNTPVTINVSPSFVVWDNLENHQFGRHMMHLEGQDAYSNEADVDAQGNMELWVKLIEKAQAVLFGGWQHVDGGVGGWPMMALEVLTGESYMEHYFDGVPEHLQEIKRESLTRPSSRTDAISTDELKATILFNLNAGHIVTAESTGHAVTVWEANADTITLRDQQLASGEDQGIKVLTWEEFREGYMKFTTRRPDAAAPTN